MYTVLHLDLRCRFCVGDVVFLPTCRLAGRLHDLLGCKPGSCQIHCGLVGLAVRGLDRHLSLMALRLVSTPGGVG